MLILQDKGLFFKSKSVKHNAEQAKNHDLGKSRLQLYCVFHPSFQPAQF